MLRQARRPLLHRCTDATSLHPSGRYIRRDSHFDVCRIRTPEEPLHGGINSGFRREVHRFYPEQASSAASFGSIDPSATWRSDGRFAGRAPRPI